MKTAVIMKREILGGEVSQNSQTEFFSATDMVRLGNAWRFKNGLTPFDLTIWFRQTGTKAFMEELESQYGPIKISARGRGTHTWVHPYLFIDLVLSINPKLKIEVYKWIYDSLLKYRNDSGDSYKKMTGALYLTIDNKSEFKTEIIDIANTIKEVCGVSDWQTASEKELQLRDKIHEYVALLSDIIRNRENLLSVAIKKAKEELSIP